MKEHITPKQAQEITEEQFYSLFSSVVRRGDWYKYHHKKVTVGKLIEFLTPISMHCYLVKEMYWSVDLIGEKHRRRIGISKTHFQSKELVDALWGATKDILNSKGVYL